MAFTLPTLFPHRQNRDRSFDSICPICFATIANEKSESDLGAFDKDHVCDPVVMFDRANFRPPTDAKNIIDLAREICNTVLRRGSQTTGPVSDLRAARRARAPALEAYLSTPPKPPAPRAPDTPPPSPAPDSKPSPPPPPHVQS